MKPLPYGIEGFNPWDFHHAQRLSTVETALRQVIELMGTYTPALQESLGKVLQQLDQGGEVASEVAATSTLVTYGQAVMPSLVQDQAMIQEVGQLLHTLGLLPRKGHVLLPLRLPAADFYALDEHFCHEEPKAEESKPPVSLDRWYRDLVWNGYVQKHVQFVKQASIFHPGTIMENVLLISLWQSTALAIILEGQPRVQFLHVRGNSPGNGATLVVSSYTHLQAIFDQKTPSEIMESVKALVVEHLFSHLSPSVAAQCGLSPTSAMTPEYGMECIADHLKDLMQYPESADPVNVDIGEERYVAIRRAHHEQLGAYTSFVLENGEVVFRDDMTDRLYLVGGSKDKPELLEVSMEQLPHVSMELLISGLGQAIHAFEHRLKKKFSVELHDVAAAVESVTETTAGNPASDPAAS